MKTLLITGGTGDIGSSIVERFQQEGYQVIAPGRQEVNLENPDDVTKWVLHLSRPVDAFIHCAGVNEPKTIESIALHDLQKTVQINAFSFYQIVHHLITAAKIKMNGHILGISSIYGSLARKGRFSYVGSKHCLHGMIKTLAIELGGRNIKANVLSPGFVDTRLTRQNNPPEKIKEFEQKIPLGRLADCADIAAVAHFMCTTNTYINGQEIIIDGGYSIGGFES